jgi:predicted GNAT family acetyltransferase
MTSMTQAPEVTDNRELSRFEIRIGDAVALLAYRRRADRLVLVHTEVPEELGGRGLAGALTLAAIDRAAAEGLTVVPLCPFARSWLEHHPDATANVSIDWGGPENS